MYSQIYSCVNWCILVSVFECTCIARRRWFLPSSEILSQVQFHMSDCWWCKPRMYLCICLFVFVTHVIHVVSKVQFQVVRCSWWQCCNSRCQIPLQFWARVRSDSQFRVRTNPRFPTSDCRSRLCQDCLVIGRRVGRVWGDNYKSRVKSRIWTAFLSSWLSWSWQKSWYSWYEHVTKTLCYFVLRWVC